MRVLVRLLAQGSSLTLASSLSADDANTLIVVVGGGRGSVLRGREPLAGIWIPLHGRLQCGNGNGETAFCTGEIRVSEAEPNLHASGRGNALWVAVLGTRNAWRVALGAFGELPVGDPPLLPALHVADRALRRDAAQLARAVRDGQEEVAIEGLLDRIIELQRALDPLIARCPGRTYAQRRQVFLRLQRVRNYLAANCHLELDNDALARMANYSPWHFIRAFRAAYRQTPHAYLVEQRLSRARRLLHTSPLAIAEIALASGFENRCAFSRLFRRHFGTTAGAMRRNDQLLQA
jgi:AraC family transcriptional regulator